MQNTSGNLLLPQWFIAVQVILQRPRAPSPLRCFWRTFLQGNFSHTNILLVHYMFFKKILKTTLWVFVAQSWVFWSAGWRQRREMAAPVCRKHYVLLVKWAVILMSTPSRCLNKNIIAQVQEKRDLHGEVSHIFNQSPFTPYLSDRICSFSLDLDLS